MSGNPVCDHSVLADMSEDGDCEVNGHRKTGPLWKELLGITDVPGIAQNDMSDF